MDFQRSFEKVKINFYLEYKPINEEGSDKDQNNDKQNDDNLIEKEKVIQLKLMKNGFK